MGKINLKLLDCTLRDGGYINDWQWGFETAREIIKLLAKSGVDIIEVGFLRNTNVYDPDITVCNYISELNKLLPDIREKPMFSAMAMRSNYDIKKLEPYNGKGIELIRVTAHDYDISEGMDFAKYVKDKGYKLSINPINIMGYSDGRILWIIEEVNKIMPYQFSIVDTFGSMKRRDLDRIVSLVDNNLDRNIRLALHLHENMSLSCSLVQNFIDKHLNRPVSVDGSLMGIGRIPGNLPIELAADYLNDYTDSNYDIDYMMDAIYDYIAPQKGEAKWGYTPAYFLSARYNLHRNYAEHYLSKGDLTNRDINQILSRVRRSKATVFDSEYADKLYEEYKNNFINDINARNELKKIFSAKMILIIAPGSTLNTHRKDITDYINTYSPIVISVNFIPQDYKVDFAFFGNNKRINQLMNVQCKIIATSNTDYKDADYIIDYNSVSEDVKKSRNSLIMLLRLLKSVNITDIAIAGADGYRQNEINYCSGNIKSHSVKGAKFNRNVAEIIKRTGMNINYLTPSEYKNVEMED